METIKQKIKNKNKENLVCEINKPDNENHQENPTILILHAITGKKENSTIHYLAKNLPESGYSTLQFDFSGHGESEGRLEECTVSKQIKDIKAILSNIKGINAKNLIVIGNSFSVITALGFAKNNPNVKGLILISGRAEYLEYTINLEEIGIRYRLFEDKFVDKSFIEDYKRYNPLKAISSISIPVLIVHGDKDKTVPVKNAQLFYNNCYIS